MSWIMLLAITATFSALVAMYKRQARENLRIAQYWYDIAYDLNLRLYESEDYSAELEAYAYDTSDIDLSWR